MSRKTLIFSGSTIFLTILIAIFYIPQTLKQRRIQEGLHNYSNPTPLPTIVPTPIPTSNNKSALEIAYDKQRQTDLLNLVNATYLYTIENTKLPADFPIYPSCIGTDPKCYNLEFLTPDQISQIPKDPQSGTEQNTGYYIFLDDGRLTASTSGGITVRK